jgi:hypothetical protein
MLAIFAALLLIAAILFLLLGMGLFLCIAEPSTPAEWDWTQDAPSEPRSSRLFLLI